MSYSPTQGDDSDPSGSYPGLPSRFMDSASGMPLSGAARTALAGAWSAGWPDPQRRYRQGRQARRLLDTARASVAAHFGVPGVGVFFTGGFDDAVGLAVSACGPGPLLVSAVEELVVLRTADLWAGRGVPMSVLPVDGSGCVDVDAVPTDFAGFLVVQDGNIEIGTRQPLARIRAAAPAATLVVDLRAVAGRSDTFPDFDIAVADATMWGGPPVGVVLVRSPHTFRPAVPRTEGHGGIESAHPAVALIAAAALALEDRDPGWGALRAVSDELRTSLATIPNSAVLGHPHHRLGYLTMVTFLYVAADELVDGLAARGWAVASGASCTSDTQRPHHVLVAIGASTHGSLRLSLAPGADSALVADLVSDVRGLVASLRAEAGTDDL